MPPDLDRLGDALTAAVARAAAVRRARRRLAGRVASAALAAAVAFVALSSGTLAPTRPTGGLLQLASTPVIAVAVAGCDQPRGARFSMPRGCLPNRPLVYPSPLGGRAVPA